MGDKLWNALDRKRRSHLHELRHADDAPDRRRVMDEIEVEGFEQGCVDRGNAAGNEGSVTVCGCPDHRLGAEIPSSA